MLLVVEFGCTVDFPDDGLAPELSDPELELPAAADTVVDVLMGFAGSGFRFVADFAESDEVVVVLP